MHEGLTSSPNRYIFLVSPSNHGKPPKPRQRIWYASKFKPNAGVKHPLSSTRLDDSALVTTNENFRKSFINKISISFVKKLRFWKHKRLLTSKLGNCSSVISNNPAFLRPFCLLELFNSTNADVGSIIDRAVSSSQDKTQENISRFWILHDSHFWLWRCGRHANTAVIYAAGTS